MSFSTSKIVVGSVIDTAAAPSAVSLMLDALGEHCCLKKRTPDELERQSTEVYGSVKCCYMCTYTHYTTQS